MSAGRAETEPDWATWRADPGLDPLTVGVEEEVMLLDPTDWSLSHRGEELLERLGEELAGRSAAETHASALEIRTEPHSRVSDVAAQLHALRCELEREVRSLGLRAAAAGTHPLAVWQDVVVSPGARQRAIYDSMRELARREPTFALHVHVGIEDPEAATRLLNRMRCHVPLLLALSANSPFWQGRDSGLASARTPIFGAFPRVGIPRPFADYSDYVETIDGLIRAGAFPEPTFLWWDVRLQPRHGTVEIRVPDAQTCGGPTAALAALIQSVARLELEGEGTGIEAPIDAPELLAENRFLAARDGMNAALVDPESESRVPARVLLDVLLDACEPHAAALGCERELALVPALAQDGGADVQRRAARGGASLEPVVAALADDLCASWPTEGAAPAAIGGTLERAAA